MASNFTSFSYPVGINVSDGSGNVLNQNFDILKLLSPSIPLYNSARNLVVNTWRGGKKSIGADAEGLKHRDIEIKRLFYVQNSTLQSKYERKRGDIALKLSQCTYKDVQSRTGKQIKTITAADVHLGSSCDSRLRECYLFHGTQLNGAVGIIQSGFNYKVYGSSDPLFGRGNYFCESSTKADQYADVKEKRSLNGTLLYMFIVKTILGNTCICDDYRTRQAIYDPSTHHSLLGLHGSNGNLRYREFVIYNDDQCLPEFLVEYYRV